MGSTSMLDDDFFSEDANNQISAHWLRENDEEA